jgi:hypothetical protein
MALTPLKVAVALTAGLLFLGSSGAAAAPIYVFAEAANDISAPARRSSSASETRRDKGDKECQAPDTKDTPPAEKKVHSWWRLDQFLRAWLGSRHRQPEDSEGTCESSGGAGWGHRSSVGGAGAGAGGGGSTGSGGQRAGTMSPEDSSSLSLPFAANDDPGGVGADQFATLDDPSDFSPFAGGDSNGGGGDPQSFSTSLTDHENPPDGGDDDAPNPRITTLTNLAPTPVPEPATLWLTATGLAAASRFRPKIKR